MIVIILIVMTIWMIVVVTMFMKFEFELYLTRMTRYDMMYGTFMMRQINIGIKYNESIRQTRRMMT